MPTQTMVSMPDAIRISQVQHKPCHRLSILNLVPTSRLFHDQIQVVLYACVDFRRYNTGSNYHCHQALPIMSQQPILMASRIPHRLCFVFLHSSQHN